MRRRGDTSWLVCLGFAGVAAAFAFGYLAGGVQVRTGLMLLSCLVAASAIAAGMRLHRVADQRPWLLVIVALGFLTVSNVAWFLAALKYGDSTPPPSPLVVPPQLAGYVLLLAASLMIVLRHAPRDASGTIDAGVWGIALAAPLWEFLFRPHMLAAGADGFTLFLVLTQLLVLLGICGSQLRVARGSRAARACLIYLFGALGCTILGTALVNIGPADGANASLPALCFAIGYLALGAAGLHPSVKQLSEPVQQFGLPAPQLRLGRLGAALLMIPLCGGLGQLFGQPADGLLLTLAPVLSIPLVLVRISRLKHALVYQATHDELTGLVNRRHLFTVMQKAIAAHADGAPGDLALIYCDLNGFKPVNDEHGHEAGDAILRAASRRIIAAVRPGDVVARIGGDEFLIFCTRADANAVHLLSDRVAAGIAEPVAWGDQSLRVTAAIGAVTWTERRLVAPDELLAAADARMYADKRRRAASAQRGQHLRAERLDERQQVLADMMQIDPLEAERGIAS
ncbi:GGDEF domain-containing protein [Actinoplanes utahensis]|uniref:GGDEF domain-containing protein n=1 Tax=Actinoplanes utahensis TaxID=1869 RepID=UPI00137818A5|nr:GGDEF domain-containing protein [Actinoplanes utahensis]